jgi:hypothetical protein
MAVGGEHDPRQRRVVCRPVDPDVALVPRPGAKLRMPTHLFQECGQRNLSGGEGRKRSRHPRRG